MLQCMPAKAAASRSGPGWVNKHFAKHNLATRFRGVVTREDVTHGKPHPEPFLLGAERLGVAPERCVVFEDGVNGFISAHAAGMKVVDVTRWITQTQA